MWADTLLDLEYRYLVRLLVWGSASAVVASMVLASLAWKRSTAPMLRSFAFQCLVWGVAVAVLSFVGWQSLALRDYGGLQQLLSFLWALAGFSIAATIAGTVVALVGIQEPRRPALMGAGIAVSVQFAALLLFSLWLVAAIGPLQ